ncbi:MAG: hypothetical protein BWX92_03655 [Deltaproteobacteria bacterium ADurb.Bin135]|nr:MAG: hypothetical protein BWX92_03655 [Deltaproteobacteria bacterium ADurb.Bin135]
MSTFIWLALLFIVMFWLVSIAEMLYKHLFKKKDQKEE